MFNIFQKKEYLIDHLQGITDIHNHILPGIDDGAAGVDESLTLLRRFKKLKITRFISTPHVMNDYYPNTTITINNALQQLKDAISKDPELQDIKITAAAEYMMDQSFIDLFEAEDLLTLSENYVLVEMSYFQAPINLNNILFQLQTKGYKPVLAHPERYAFYHTKDLRKYRDLKSRGCLMQVNALSLSNHYGKRMQDTAFKLLENDMIDFIGSDTHREQHLDKLEKIRIPKKLSLPLLKVIGKTKDLF